MGSNPIPSARYSPDLETLTATKPMTATMDSYYLWTIGCQMNQADSDRLAGALEQMGLHSVSRPEQADVIVLNSCVVRQGAEDRVVGSLTSLKPLKTRNPDKILALMGCMVGPKQDELKARYPYVDFFMPPQQFAPLLDRVGDDLGVEWGDYLGPHPPCCSRRQLPCARSSRAAT